MQVQALLKKAAGLDIQMICPLHGPVWRNNLNYFIEKHDKWSKYEPEDQAVAIIYGSIYGNTEQAADALAAIFELVKFANTNVSEASSDRCIRTDRRDLPCQPCGDRMPDIQRRHLSTDRKSAGAHEGTGCTEQNGCCYG